MYYIFGSIVLFFVGYTSLGLGQKRRLGTAKKIDYIFFLISMILFVFMLYFLKK